MCSIINERKCKTDSPRVTVLFLLAKFNTRFKQSTNHFKEKSKESRVTLVVIYNLNLLSHSLRIMLAVTVYICLFATCKQ